VSSRAGTGVRRFLCAGFAGGCGATLVDAAFYAGASSLGRPSGVLSALALACLVYVSVGTLLGAFAWLFAIVVARLKLDASDAEADRGLSLFLQRRALGARALIVALCLLGLGITLGRVLAWAAPIPTPLRRLVLLTLGAGVSSLAWLLIYRLLVVRVVEFVRLSRHLFRTLLAGLLVAALVAVTVVVRNPSDLRSYLLAVACGFTIPALVAALRPQWLPQRRSFWIAVLLALVGLTLVVARSPYQALYLLRTARASPTLFLRELPLRPPAAYAEIDQLVASDFKQPKERTPGLSAFTRLPSAARPNVLLLTVDTLRADRLHVQPDGRVVMPSMREFAGKATLYNHAFSTASTTISSFTQMMTGMPGHELAYLNTAPGTTPMLDPTATTVAEVLRRDGYRTHAFIASGLVAVFPSIVFGFDDLEKTDAGGQPLLWAKSVVDAVIRESESTSEPSFFWAHMMDVHDKRGATPGSTAVDAYNQSVEIVDRELGRLFQKLAQLPNWSDALVIFTSDHGEGLGEARLTAHGLCHALTLAVPLVIRYPGGGAEVVHSTVGHLDLAPTILGAVGLSAPGFPGRDLRTLPPNQTWAATGALFEQALYTEDAYPIEVGVVAFPWLLSYDVRGRFPVLIDLANDPAGLSNRAGQGLAEEITMRALLRNAWKPR
jgi:arylsulfatase A-like enzyme